MGTNDATTTHIDAERTEAVRETIEVARSAKARNVPESDLLHEVESALLALASNAHLFGPDEFPQPSDEEDRNYLIHQDPDGSVALYVSIAVPGVVYEPHDHGGTWASIVAVEGEQHHRFWSADDGTLECVGDAVCRPGTAVSVPTDAIHSITGGSEMLTHLHLYGLGFEHQGIRRVFDPATQEESRVQLADFSWIEDRRPGVTRR